ncbi:terminase small subunit protein [Aureimonas mangrovi]|uniref:terminase small subunit-like protein n=1 Tax=Aureimonas mangrovi TaxID=2758041 RepID=UPI001FE98505|nr:terminase small subunit protein [Aureimonas mangrovi]
MSRPSTFTQEIADVICERIADGESLRSICSDEGMPSKSSVFKWLGEQTSFSDQYARAREAQADALFDEIVDIADDGRNDWMEKRNADGEHIGWTENGEAMRRSVLRVDARKWMAGKLRPKVYGDKVALTGASGGAIEHSHSVKDLTDDELARIALGGGNGAAAPKEGA